MQLLVTTVLGTLIAIGCMTAIVALAVLINFIYDKVTDLCGKYFY